MSTTGRLASMSRILKVLSLAATLLAFLTAGTRAAEGGAGGAGAGAEAGIGGGDSPASRALLEREGQRDLPVVFHPIRFPHGAASYQTSHPSDDETVYEIWHPSCFGKQSALLGSFCVGTTNEEQEKDPQHKLPRITFSVDRHETADPITIFLFDDEASSWPKFWSSSMQNKSCEELRPLSKSVMLEIPGKGRVEAHKNIMEKSPHYWYLVAVNCNTRAVCPEVLSANITFFHPGSNGRPDLCVAKDEGAVTALQDAVKETMNALQMENLLHVVGLTPFGVAVLYIDFTAMLLCSFLFLIEGLRVESQRRFLYFNTFFITSISAMAYLAMASGNGIMTLRKVDGVKGESGRWHFTNPLFTTPGSALHPNPMYNEAYATASAYPVFYARYVLQFFTSPLILLDLFLITGVGFATRAFMLFSNAMMVLCWGCGAFITSPSRWGFWIFGLLFSLGVLIPLIGVLPTAAARKGRAARRLYGRLMCITLFTGLMYPWAWVLVDGAHAVTSDVAALIYAVLDFVSQCVFGVMLVRKAPALADWGDDLQATVGLRNTNVGDQLPPDEEL